MLFIICVYRIDSDASIFFFLDGCFHNQWSSHMRFFFLCCSCPRPSCWLYASSDYSQNFFSCPFLLTCRWKQQLSTFVAMRRMVLSLYFLLDGMKYLNYLKRLKETIFLGIQASSQSSHCMVQCLLLINVKYLIDHQITSGKYPLQPVLK